MAKKSAKKKRRRVSREDAKKRMASGGSGGDWFTLPNGIERWLPDKKGTYLIDILPYEVSTDNHPEDGIESGVLWFRTNFRVHHGIGVKDQSVVCPRSIGKACAICDEVDRLRKEDRDANEDVINSLKGQVFSVMNIKHPDDEDAVAVFALSYGKFDKILKEELQEEENEDHLDFYQCDEGGRTLRVRFSEKTFAGNKYLQATQIQFKEREEMDEDEILEKVVDLDSILNVLPSEKIKTMFLEGEEPEDETDEPEEDEEEKKPKPRKKSSKKKPAKKKASKKKAEPEPEEDEDEDWDEEEDEEEIPEGNVECKACEGTGISSKGKTCRPCKGNGYHPAPEEEESEEDEDEDWDDEDDVDEAPEDESDDADDDDWDDEEEESEEEESEEEESEEEESEDDDDWDDDDDEEDDDDWDDDDDE